MSKRSLCTGAGGVAGGVCAAACRAEISATGHAKTKAAKRLRDRNVVSSLKVGILSQSSPGPQAEMSMAIRQNCRAFVMLMTCKMPRLHPRQRSRAQHCQSAFKSRAFNRFWRIRAFQTYAFKRVAFYVSAAQVHAFRTWPSETG